MRCRSTRNSQRKSSFHLPHSPSFISLDLMEFFSAIARSFFLSLSLSLSLSTSGGGHFFLPPSSLSQSPPPSSLLLPPSAFRLCLGILRTGFSIPVKSTSKRQLCRSTFKRPHEWNHSVPLHPLHLLAFLSDNNLLFIEKVIVMNALICASVRHANIAYPS